VNLTVFNGPPRCHQCLAGYLTAKDPLSFFIGLDAAKDVDLDRFKIEKVDQEI
jgi:hypothetical protein